MCKENTTEIIKKLICEAMDKFNENKEVEPYLTMPTEELKEEYNKIINYEGDNKFCLEMKEKYEKLSLENFCEDYEGLIYKEDGGYSTYNPNSKWDWYVIGGRWNESLPIKNGTNDKINDYNIDSAYIDNLKNNCCRIKNLVITKSFDEKETEELKKKYDEMITKGDFYSPKYYKEKYPTFEIFLDYTSQFSTYALLTSKGEWIEPGEMGWFGCSSASLQEEVGFKNIFKDTLEKEKPEDYFVLIDCHI